MDDFDRKTHDDIERFGCSVIHVLAEDELPPFSYSVGIAKMSSSPEVVVVGLKQPIAHFVVNEYNRRVRSGEVFRPGGQYSGFLGGFDVVFEKVDLEFYREYFGYDIAFHKGTNFDVLQVVYPDTSGRWPWQPDASEGFRRWQPILTSQPATPR